MHLKYDKYVKRGNIYKTMWDINSGSVSINNYSFYPNENYKTHYKFIKYFINNKLYTDNEEYKKTFI